MPDSPAPEEAISTPSLTIRLDAETFARVHAKGGSPWVRDLILTDFFVADRLRERSDGEPLEELVDPPAEPAAEAVAEPLADPDAELKKVELCPRWMHHQGGVFCPVCGETPL